MENKGKEVVLQAEESRKVCGPQGDYCFGKHWQAAFTRRDWVWIKLALH